MADPENKVEYHVDREVCTDFARSSQLEWLQTNHTGAFAMGTVAGVNTRRYHGLLIATLNPPADRYSIVPRVEETVEIDEGIFQLATVQYPGVVSPAGYGLLEGFSLSSSPTWRYRCAALQVDKAIHLVENEQTVIISYRVNSPCRIQVRLFLSFRDYHSLTHKNQSFNPQVDQQPGCLSLRPYPDLPLITFRHNARVFEHSGTWFHDHEYLREMERGLDFKEDLYSPGVLHFDVSPDAPIELTATLETETPKHNDSRQPPTDPLTRALDQFRVLRADRKPTLIAGYPWFTDWSRDTLISLPSLIASGFPPEETRAILDFLLAERKQGILPNRFSDRQSTPEYNTVDASLWFFIAADAYLNSTQDFDFLQRTLLSAAKDIIDWHKRGTFSGIRVDPSDHLLCAGEAGTQLTWMDAKVGDHVITPRVGKPVEINSLWFNALQITSKWASQLYDKTGSEELLAEALLVQTAFAAKFWNAARGCLYDVIELAGPDPSLRPNQLFAVSLPYPLLSREQAQSIVQIVRQTLLTPAGLRTLEPGDPRYCSHFEGNMASRDSSYHQGTVWPWLIGPYVNAYLYAFSNSVEAQSHCREITTSILNLMDGACLGTIGEVYDAEPPHRPGGCPAQLWSVAQTILALQRLSRLSPLNLA